MFHGAWLGLSEKRTPNSDDVIHSNWGADKMFKIMDATLVKYILNEIVHTQTQLLALKEFCGIKFKNPNLTDEVIRGSIDLNLLFQNVEEGMKSRAKHEGVDLDGLLD